MFLCAVPTVRGVFKYMGVQIPLVLLLYMDDMGLLLWDYYETGSSDLGIPERYSNGQWYMELVVQIRPRSPNRDVQYKLMLKSTKNTE